MAQIGTIRLDTQNNGTVSVPVFDTGDSGSDVYEFVRVQTASGTGFIPVVAPSDAAFPYLRVQSQNQGVVAVHNESSLIQIVDDFEDGDYDEYVIRGGSGSNVSVQTSTVAVGTYALEIAITNGDNTNIASQSGLPNYPSAGDTVQFYIRSPDGGTNNQLKYWYATSDNDFTEYYQWDFRYGDNQIRMRWDDGGANSTVTSSSFSFNTNEWYRVVLEWTTGGSHNLEMFDSNDNSVFTISANQSNYTSGGIGWSNQSLGDTTGYFDDLKIL